MEEGGGYLAFEAVWLECDHGFDEGVEACQWDDKGLVGVINVEWCAVGIT